MKIHTIMPSGLKPFFAEELQQASDLFAVNRLREARRHLERAHILGQPYPYHHTLVHWKMLGFGMKIKNTKEVFGQIPRLLVGGVKSFVGEIPMGNTGGANVPPLRPMDIPEDLMEIINQQTKKNGP